MKIATKQKGSHYFVQFSFVQC